MVCVPLPVCELSTTVRLALNVPVVVGVNLTAIVHLAPAASELPQVLLCAKSAEFVPVTLIPAPVKISGVAPGLITVTFNVLLVACLIVPKLRLVGLKLTRGSITDALSVTA